MFMDQALFQSLGKETFSLGNLYLLRIATSYIKEIIFNLGKSSGLCAWLCGGGLWRL